MRIYFLMMSAALTAALWAQAPRQPTTSGARPGTAPTTPTQPSAPGRSPTQPTNPNTPTQPANGNNQNTQISGFDGVTWGTMYKDMKERFRVMASNSNANGNDNVEIIADTPDREI
ncbi:MAG TPA: hypothetical protein PLY93_10635 [Turneriella sp.]|nr:hypothetical protein [Turneriella sp.]